MRIKIIELERVCEFLDPLRAEAKRIVQCHGCFDLLHLGHVHYLKAAKSLGDILVVTLTADAYVNKGPDRPVFSDQLRAEFIAELECVDFVSITHFSNAIFAISCVRPDVFVKGGDFKELNKALLAEQKAVQSVGGQIYFTAEYRFVPCGAIAEVPFHSSDFLRMFRR